MSTTFDVYPGIAVAPLLGDVLQLGEQKMHAYLAELGLKIRPGITARLQAKADHQHLPLSSSFFWTEDAYLWCTVDDIAGGTGAYCWPQTTSELTGALEELGASTLARILPATSALGLSWYFRRSAGQPAPVVLAYGCLASALAELTQGVVTSFDGAWNMPQFHLGPAEFDRAYLRPEAAFEARDRAWAEQIQQGLLQDFGH